MVRNLFLVLLFTSSTASAATFYVAPNGTSQGNGSISQPWNLVTVMNHPAQIVPGDTIYLRGGTYNGPFRSFLRGTSSALITLKSYPSETATIDNPNNLPLGAGVTGASASFTFSGDYTRLERVIVTNSSTKRSWSGSEWLSCYPNCLGDGVADNGRGNQVVHNIIHDVGIGISSQGGAGGGSLYYGNVFYYIGWDETGSTSDGSANGRGHAFYVQNDCAGGRKIIENNIDFWSYAMSQQIYGSSGATVECVDAVGNVIFENGQISARTGGGFILGGNAGASDLSLRNNIVYSSLGCDSLSRFDALRPAYLIAPDRLDIRDNYFKGCDAVDYNLSLPNLTHSGNVWVGGLGNSPTLVTSQFAGDTFLPFTGDNATRITERWSTIDSDWGYLVVINNPAAATVSWTPSSCASTKRMEVREVMNPTGGAVMSFNCDGTSRSIPMDYTGPIVTPIGTVANPPTGPDRKFRVFLLSKFNRDVTPPAAPGNLRIN